jgi:hypothetical protein
VTISSASVANLSSSFLYFSTEKRLMNRNAYLLVLQTTLLIATAVAEEPSPAKQFYKTLGTPAEPKVAIQWNRYHDYTEATKLLQDLARLHPEVCRLQSLGKSYGGREMWVATITNFAVGPEADRPAFWIDGGIHANEIQSVEVVLYTAWYLCEMREQSDTIKTLLNERVFYLLPMLSPDSRDAHFYEPNSTHSPRSGQRPFDDDQDGLVDEDGPDDLDGDGSITTMRVRDRNGRWKSHPDFPDLMIRAKDGEPGEYEILGQEGFDNDADGDVNEDGDGFYDPNRDWGWLWQPPYVQYGAHRYPFSILENRMAADFIAAHPHIAGAQSYHNAGGMILHGPGALEDAFDPADVRIYDTLGKRGEEMLPGYRSINTAKDLYEVYGGSLDWLHQTRGVFAFTNELFTPFNYFRKGSHEGFFGGDETRATFDKYLLLSDGMVKWHEVDHPQYGKVEVGGAKKTWTRQPPSFLLEEECHRNMAFTLHHADQMARVRVQSATTRKIGDALIEVTAVIENTRFCPTHSAADLKRKITPPDEVTLSGKDLKVILGLVSNERFFKEPREQRRNPQALQLDSLAGNSVTYVRWLVQGEGSMEVSVRSIKGGQNRMNVEPQAQ